MLEACKSMLKHLDNSDLDIEHYIIVPDRLSLQMEKLVLEVLQKECVFNVSVVGLTSFASKVLDLLGEKYTVLSNSEVLLITEDAIKNVESQLLSLKKSNINFVYEISKVISQFKSCKISPRELENCSSLIASRNKFHDLSLIYGEYERLIEDKLDANKMLVKFKEKLACSRVLKNSKVYFAGFESLTEEVYELIEVLFDCTSELAFTLAKPLTIGNDYIYDNDILNKLTTLTQKHKLSLNVISSEEQLNNNQHLVLKSLYSSNIEKAESKSRYFTLIPSSNKTTQISAIGKIIKYKISQGARFMDFALACGGGEKYYPIIESVFDELQIPYYIDQSITADKTILANFIFKFLELVITGFSNENILGLFSSPLLEIEDRETLIDYIKKYQLEGRHKFIELCKDRLPDIVRIIENLTKSATTIEFCSCIDNIIELAQDRFISTMQLAKDKGYLRELSINEQMPSVLGEVLAILVNYNKDKQIYIKEFYRKLKLLLSFKEVFSVPAFVDAVLIGDATSTPFVDFDNLFIVGGEELPLISGDNGLVSDDDIYSAKLSNKIEPTIRMINRRNRFKLFSLLSVAKSSLYVGYLNVNSDGKKNEMPSYIEDLLSIFGNNSVSARTIDEISPYKNNQSFLLSLGSKKSALKNLFRYYKSGHIDYGKVKSLSNVLSPNYQEFYLERENISLESKAVFFPKGYTKATQLESYFDCPFKHFVRYGLRLAEPSFVEFDSRDIGNICHKMAELFVNENLNNFVKQERACVEKFIYKNFDYILKCEKLDERFAHCKQKEFLKSYIIGQCNMILSRIVYEQSQSDFHPIYTEKSMTGLSFDYSGEKLQVIGKVDRIDVSDKFFRIIDYKTGDVGGIIKDLYYGDKLQLFIYEKGISQTLNKPSAGVFYFDCKWDYLDKNEDKTILKGIMASDEEAIGQFDRFIEEKSKSDVAPFALTTAKVKTKMYKGQSISKHGLTLYEDYAKKISEIALSELKEGYIAPKPDENSCQTCKYLGICLYSKTRGVRKKTRKGQDSIAEALGGGDEE